MTNRNDRERDRRSNQAGSRQRSNTKPWGYAKAIIRKGENNRFVLVGSVWETDNGNLKLRIEATPNEWNDPHVAREVVLTRAEQQRQQGGDR